MAEGIGGTANVICRYFLNGVCNDGENCYFAHHFGNGMPDKVCRYYLKGNCIFGSQCRNDHIGLTPDDDSRNNLINLISCSEEPRLAGVRSHKNVFKDESSMVVLKKDKSPEIEPSSKTNTTYFSRWVNAPEFIPQEASPHLTYAEVVHPDYSLDTPPLCPYAAEGFECSPTCLFLHGDACDLCEKLCLHPTDTEQRKQHREECLREIEKNMEHSFAIQRSIGKTCGICMEVIMDKEPSSERRFGILEKCSHIFCLNCIRQWRQTKQFDSKNTRGCPECRTLSDFVTPSKYWVEDQDEKKKIIKEYKDAMSKKPCKYFKQGQGACPFGGACFYNHTLSDGTKVDLPPPRPRRRRNQDGELRGGGMEQVFLWEFLDVEDSWSHLEELEWSSFVTDSDDNTSEVSFELIFS